MKNLMFTLLLIAAMFQSVQATDLAVSEGGGGGSYSNITDALNAAAGMDVRFVSISCTDAACRVELQNAAGQFMGYPMVISGVSLACPVDGLRSNKLGHV